MTATAPRRRSTAYRAAALLVALTAASACSGSDTASPDTSTEVTASETTVADTTEPTAEETTTTSSTTSSTSTTTSTTTTSTTAPPSTPAPTTTDPTAWATEERVRADLAADYEFWRECVTDPENCDREQLALYRADGVLEGANQTLDDYLDSGERIRDVDTLRYTINSIDIDTEDRTARVEMCEIDESVIYVPATAEEPERIVDDDFWSTQQVLLMRYDGERWVNFAIDGTQVTVIGEENNQCA